MPGAIISIILWVLIIIYSLVNFITLVERSEYQLIQELYEFKFDQTFQFGEDDGFAVAAAITNFDGSELDIEDATYGVLKFVRKSWGTELNGTTFEELDTRKCTEADFNGEGTFWPL